jgi:hypothetical protein
MVLLVTRKVEFPHQGQAPYHSSDAPCPATGPSEPKDVGSRRYTELHTS